MEHDHDPVLCEDESAALLGNSHAGISSPTSSLHSFPTPAETRTGSGNVKGDIVPERVLPIALLASLAMASTAATALFAYATLLCKDPQHCRDDETRRYSSFAAGAISISNIVGMLALGYLQKAAAKGKLGLMLWMVARSMSVVMLLVGVFTKRIYVALSGRVFEGLASDNLLHFMLNAAYSRSSSEAKTSSLINNSLGLYMLGISISPFIAGLFKNFTVSFFIAIGFFAVSIMYVLLCVPSQPYLRNHPKGLLTSESDTRVVSHGVRRRSIGSLGSTFLTPLMPFRKQPTHLLIGFNILTYNITQSYTFSALMVYTSVRFGFTGKENGILISMVHTVAAFYIFANIYFIPWALRRRLRQNRNERTSPQMSVSQSNHRVRDMTLALISLTIQCVAFVGLGLTTRGSQVYFVTVLLALGLPAPSFTKAYFASLFEGEEKPVALAALAMMETVGSLLGPLILGSLQAYFGAGSGVFYVAAGLDGVSVLLLGLGLVVIGTVSKY
ncbi:major facilitator superfamily domain-containing protein [Annulohypoxylon maeteangense]|uniref:major facilitator superfamily domain-containing protein n=1 Tax=Annulohypoxylon maeteangense TaxID=1927788 RepID=UPI0020079D56|nr:major facilitator superfamily domain-containing protein [Annulohypoxylon maeteangense]KAI0886473.1 major facilitator superfamily domain-containing protein [Annulohypoxylon maeteangense]